VKLFRPRDKITNYFSHCTFIYIIILFFYGLIVYFIIILANKFNEFRRDWVSHRTPNKYNHLMQH
jgi:hypothetical protein